MAIDISPTRGALDDRENEAFVTVDGKYHKAVYISGSYSDAVSLINSSQWMDLAVYDQITVSTSADKTVTTMSYYEDTFLIGTAVITFTNQNTWTVQLTRYLLDDDGSILQDDDDSYLNLE